MFSLNLTPSVFTDLNTLYLSSWACESHRKKLLALFVLVLHEPRKDGAMMYVYVIFCIILSFFVCFYKNNKLIYLATLQATLPI